MLGSLFGSFTGALGKRFFLTAWLPSLLLAGAVLAELATAPGLSRTVDWVQSLPGLAQAAGVAAFLLAVTVAATLISVNVTSLLRFCEGYWGAGWLHRHVGCRRRAHYRDVVAKLSSTDPGYEQIYQRFPPPDLQDAAMPTRVGNILLGSEIYPYVRYGMDAVLFWPRLYHVVPDSVRDTVAAARAPMEQMLSLMAAGLAFSGIGTVIALALLPWYVAPLCFAVGAMTAAVSYRGLVSACVPYAETVKAAFDVYRQELLGAIGWHAAPGLEAERYQWAQVGGLWYRINPDDPAALGYRPFAASFALPRGWRRPAPAGLTGSSCAGAKPMAHLWRRISAAATAFALIVGVVSAARQRVIEPSPFPSITVVVAARHLQAFSPIGPAQLRAVQQGWSPTLLGLAETPKQLIGHVLLSDVPAGQAVPAAEIGPTMPQRTVALAVTLDPAESLAASIRPGDTINVIPACAGQPVQERGTLTALTVLAFESKPANQGHLPASITVVLAVPVDDAARAAKTLLGCTVAISPASLAGA